jgi:pSer/pThr/pTyr-binding forkhead associated (FHA) protein
MSRASGGDTRTQEEILGGALPVALRWLVPDELPSVPLGLQPITIGRGRRCKVVLADEFLSETHAEIRNAEAAFVACDLGSKNGTFVNGVRIQRALVRVGDVLRVGETVGLFVARPPGSDVISKAGSADRDRRLAAFRAAWGVSPSEERTLAQLVLGIPNKVIADQTSVSISTIESHVTALLRSARASNRASLVAKFWSTAIPTD